MSSGLFACCVNPQSPCPDPGFVAVAGILDEPILDPVPYQLWLVDTPATGDFENNQGDYTYWSSASNLWEFCSPTQGDKLTIVGVLGTCAIWCFNGATWESTNSPSNVYTGVNLAGATFPIFSAVVANEFQFRGLEAGANIILTAAGNNVRITGTIPGGGGEANTASNLGTAGAQIGSFFTSKTGVNLAFKRLKSNSAQLTISETVSYVELALAKTIPDPATVANVGSGVGIWKDLTGGFVNRLKTLLGANGIGIAGGTDEVTIGINWAATLANLGGGAEVWKDYLGQVNFRTLLPGVGISVTQNADDITFAGTYSATNVGASGLGVFKTLNVDSFEFYKLVAGAGVTLTQIGDTVSISAVAGAAGPNTVAGNEGLVGGTVVPADASWVVVPFEATVLANANVTPSGGGDEYTLNATDVYLVSAKVTLQTGVSRTQHAIRIAYFDGVDWDTIIPGSLAYASTPNDANDLQTIHTGICIVSATATHKVRVEVMASTGTLDAEILDEATSITIYRG